MITLNEIAYNIKNLAYGGHGSTENNISIHQIKHWVHYHRAKLIADNFNKGITNNQSIYQNMELTVGNSAIPSVAGYFNDYLQYNKGTQSSLGQTISYGDFIGNQPTFGNNTGLAGPWIPYSSVSSQEDEGNISESGWYGEELSSSQIKGDFRNFGYHDFYIPKPLQLQNDEGIKNVRVKRAVHKNSTYDPFNDGFDSKYISLYRKEYNNFDEHNKFTDNTKPYYTQKEEVHGFQVKDAMHDNRTQVRNTSYLSLRQLQVSPNYLNDLDGPGAKRIYWRYIASVEAVLQNPTDISMMWNQPDMLAMRSFQRPTIYGIKEYEWNDSEDSYPIPMEYVSDLIQRVIQVEMQTVLKTQKDEITDGLDDNLRAKGSGA